MRVAICTAKDGSLYGEVVLQVELPESPQIGDEIMALVNEDHPKFVVKHRRWVAARAPADVSQAYLAVSVQEVIKPSEPEQEMKPGDEPAKPPRRSRRELDKEAA